MTYKEKSVSLEDQEEITRLCLECAVKLIQHGAESALVDLLARRAGLALDMTRVDLLISGNAITLTTVFEDRWLTATRSTIDAGINMHAVQQVYYLVQKVENGMLTPKQFRRHLSKIVPRTYSRSVMVGIVGLSCGCFCLLNGGSWEAFLVTLLASGCAMYVRLEFAARRANVLINFFVTAFVATLIAGFALEIFEQSRPVSHIAMAASVLLLVPGFPLINAVADIFKGFVETGLARWATATMLALSTCIGVSIALALGRMKGWM